LINVISTDVEHKGTKKRVCALCALACVHAQAELICHRSIDSGEQAVQHFVASDTSFNTSFEMPVVQPSTSNHEVTIKQDKCTALTYMEGDQHGAKLGTL
jgi:hypothetical protein